MNNLEFSNQFDTLVSSYRRFRDFDKQEPLDTIEFDEYEKSLYLTKAQEELVLSLYTGKNPYGESFEQIEELRRYLATLVKEEELFPIENSSGTPLGLESSSKFFTLPEDLWFITYERAIDSNDSCEETQAREVYPVRQDEYNKIRKNPFRGANGRRALRLDLSEGVVEIVSRAGITSYYIRYVRKVLPIILEDMPNDITINGIGSMTESELPEMLHQRILERAVQMALQSRGYTNNNRE